MATVIWMRSSRALKAKWHKGQTHILDKNMQRMVVKCTDIFMYKYVTGMLFAKQKYFKHTLMVYQIGRALELILY